MEKCLPDIIAQHAEESALCWLRRDAAATQPHYSRNDLARLDNRLDAHLDGLRIAGEAGWEAVEQELRWAAPGEVFAALVLACECGREDRIQRVLGMAAASGALARAAASAFGWLPFPKAAAHVERLLDSQSPAHRRIGIAAAAVHRRDPGSVLAGALDDADDRLRARALRAAGELGRTDLAESVRGHLDESQADCRLAAACSLVLLAGSAEAVRSLRAAVESGAAGARQALQLAVCRGDFAAAEGWIRMLASRPSTTRAAIIAAGALGSANLVPLLLELMPAPVHARLAAEAFTLVVGLDLARDRFDAKAPGSFESGPTENPADENVAMDLDENLPWPDREKIGAWWKAHSADFTSGTRYLLGKPITKDWLEHVLRHGFQRQRAAAALELAIRRPGTPLFEVRAPGFRQQELLG